VGINYKFKIQARNAVGYGQNTSEIIVRAAKVPDAPISVTTTIDQTNVQISWTPSYNGGIAILSYKIVIQSSDLITFIEDDVDCSGLNQLIFTSASCKVPITTLRSSPYNLPLAPSVDAKVIATNIVGDSAYSAVGNGASYHF